MSWKKKNKKVEDEVTASEPKEVVTVEVPQTPIEEPVFNGYVETKDLTEEQPKIEVAEVVQVVELDKNGCYTDPEFKKSGLVLETKVPNESPTKPVVKVESKPVQPKVTLKANEGWKKFFAPFK